MCISRFNIKVRRDFRVLNRSHIQKINRSIWKFRCELNGREKGVQTIWFVQGSGKDVSTMHEDHSICGGHAGTNVCARDICESNSNTLFMRTKRANWIMSRKALSGIPNCCLRKCERADIPSSCGILGFRLTTSSETKMASAGRVSNFLTLERKSFVSQRYDVTAGRKSGAPQSRRPFLSMTRNRRLQGGQELQFYALLGRR
jgi:hypothetical protein